MSNLDLYNKLRVVPKEAIKPIASGRLKGKSDINPMWRIKAMTEAFGVCGIGWKYVITKQWTETYGSETKAYCNVDLFVKVDGEWSDAIQGTGGSSEVAMERNGAYVSDECVDGECEVLTPNGWKKFKDYDGNEEIAQFNKDTSIISFVKPTMFIHKKSNNLYDKGGIIMTANHRNIVYSRNRNERIVFLAHELANLSYKPSLNGYGRSSAYRDIKCGILGEPKQLTNIQKIGIMIACDGTLYRKNQNGDTVWRLEFSKDRKIIKAKDLLEKAGIRFCQAEQDRAYGNRTTSFTFVLNGRFKDYSFFLPFGNYPDLWDEVVSWDGHRMNDKHEVFDTTNVENAKYLQTLFALSNEVVTCTEIKRKNEKHHTLYRLYKKQNETGLVGVKPYKGELDVYCVRVPTTFFIIRKGMDIIVTGNCYKMALTDALSVAMKALGVAADIYFERDVTKYTADYQQTDTQQKQQVATQTQYHPESLEEAMCYLGQCTTIEHLKWMMQTYKPLMSNPQFMQSLSAKRKQLGI